VISKIIMGANLALKKPRFPVPVKSVFIDTNIFVYAIGKAHKYRNPCRTIVQQLATGEVRGEMSVEVVQEFTHIRRRQGFADSVIRSREIIAVVAKVHAAELRDLDTALMLIEKYDNLPVRDAMHAASAINRGITSILSTDKDFDEVHEIERIDPADLTAVRALLA
jgi:uncharacterized protein